MERLVRTIIRGEVKKSELRKRGSFLDRGEAELTKIDFFVVWLFVFHTRYKVKNHIYPTEGEGGNIK